MKTLKMSLANIQGKLSRAEMRKVMAGTGECTCSPACGPGYSCQKDYNLGGCSCQPNYA